MRVKKMISIPSCTTMNSFTARSEEEVEKQIKKREGIIPLS